MVSRRVVRAARKLRFQPAIHLVGPPTSGKTTLFQYLRHPSRVDERRRTLVQRRTGRIAADLLEDHRWWLRPKIIDDGLGRQTNQWVERLHMFNPEGLIFIVDTQNPDEDHTYFQDLYNSYRDFGKQAKRVNLRVLLILLNKFDRWGSTTESREAMMHRYRSEICQEVVNRFRSTFRITVQFGYSSLTHREHFPYNNLMLKEFLAVLEPKR
jgi:GTPase involved in cell partitioning and DNA repair